MLRLRLLLLPVVLLPQLGTNRKFPWPAYRQLESPCRPPLPNPMMGREWLAAL